MTEPEYGDEMEKEATREPLMVECELCEGKGQILQCGTGHTDGLYTCPRCHGRKLQRNPDLE